jgi:hypothetical protein
MNKVSIFVVMFLTLTLTFTFGGDTRTFKKPGDIVPIRQAFMEKSPGTFNQAEYVQKQQQMFDRLMAEAASLTPDSIFSIPVSAADLAGIENYQCESCGGTMATTRKVRIGVVKSVGMKAEFDRMRRPMPDGGFTWTVALESPTATALRVHFTDFSVSPNAEVYVYGMNGEAFGPYTGSGPGNSNDFWSNTVSGSVAFVQLRQYGNSSPVNRFTIADIGYLGEKFLLPFMQQPHDYNGDIGRSLAHCPGNENCVEDASCYSGSAINDAKLAAAHMQWVSGAWLYYCSGGLIADTDSSTQIPYFLTANHCLSRGKDAKALECYFQYWTANCHGACYDPVGAVPRTLGADIMDSSRNGDHTLLQLWEDPPAGSVFMGWTTNPVAFADGTHLFRISHPSGEAQAYSEHVVDSQYVECGGLPIGEFIYSQDVVGATEGGSSGSPVMNMSGQIVGQLYGACGYTLEVCDPVENRTVDGAFAYYYPSVAPYLDPTPGGGDNMHVASIVLSTKAKGPRTDAVATVTIVDSSGNPVSGATVTGTFSGDASGTDSGDTNASGVATLKITVQGSISTFSFCVDNVALSGWTYDSGSNVETCDTY